MAWRPADSASPKRPCFPINSGKITQALDDGWVCLGQCSLSNEQSFPMKSFRFRILAEAKVKVCQSMETRGQLRVIGLQRLLSDGQRLPIEGFGSRIKTLS